MAPLLDVAIIGAGPVGLATALLLERKGLEVRVFETSVRRPRPGGIIIQPGTRSLLDQLAPGWNENAYPVTKVTERLDERVLFHGDYPRTKDGSTAVIVRLADLHQHLQAFLTNHSLADHQMVEGITHGAGHVLLHVGHSKFAAKSVVLATGRNISLREAAGFTFDSTSVGGAQYITRIDSDSPLDLLVDRWADGMITQLPAKSRKVIVYTSPRYFTQKEAEHAARHRLQQIGAPTESGHWEAHQIRHEWGSVTRLRQGRTFVVGDTAHTVHNLGGQGLNISLQELPQITAAVAETSRNEPPSWFDSAQETLRARVRHLFTRQRELLDDLKRPESWFSENLDWLATNPYTDHHLIT